MHKTKKELEKFDDEQFKQWFEKYSIYIDDEDLLDYAFSRMAEIKEKND